MLTFKAEIGVGVREEEGMNSDPRRAPPGTLMEAQYRIDGQVRGNC